MSLKAVGILAPSASAEAIFSRTLPLCRYNSTVSSPATIPSSPQNQRLVKSKKTQRYEKQWNQQKQREQRAKSLERNQTRQWKTGDAYSPHDLSPSEMRKWRKRSSPATDAFDVLGLDPLHQYKNFAIMSEYITEMGRIKHSSETGLRPVNQRKLSKAIRRAVGLGLMPSVHKHPEILLRENNFEP